MVFSFLSIGCIFILEGEALIGIIFKLKFLLFVLLFWLKLVFLFRGAI